MSGRRRWLRGAVRAAALLAAARARAVEERAAGPLPGAASAAEARAASSAAGPAAPFTAQAVAAARALLADARAEGLEPADYALPPGATDEHVAAALARYLSDLHRGRVDPRRLGFGLPPRAHEHDFDALAGEALRHGRPAEAAEALRPPLPPYRDLLGALADLRALASAHEARPWAPWPATPTLRPGDRHPQLTEVARRLAVLGDLAGAPPAAEASLQGPLLAALQRFQRRHGLEPDGVLGRASWAALAVDPGRRARQVELALERLRWLPHADGRRIVVVDIPLFRLWSRDPAEPGRAGPSMAVIVGRAMRTATPVFLDEIRWLVFRPYWNVPRSIVRGEILPRLARDPGHLARERLELVRGGGDDALPVAPDAANLALLRDGVLRLRQRPGEHNALGLLKFVFPNDANVYLHGTPAPQLFRRARRDFSHGCIRVEDPAALAAWLLSRQPGWDRARIEAAMRSGRDNRRVDLDEPVRVLLYYVTALALPGEPRPHFAEDLYGHDAALERALAARR